MATYPRQGQPHQATRLPGGNPQAENEGCTSRGPLGTNKPLSLAALDSAISETIGAPCRRDRLARDDAVFRAIVRRTIAEGSLSYRTTYAELAAGAGYAVPRLNCRPNRRQAREQRVSTVYRALRSLQAAGLVRFGGIKRHNGQWRCLGVTLLPAAFAAYCPWGRSRRAPRRGPGGRISFLRRSGTSPAVVTTKNRSRSAGVRARAREGPPDEDASTGGRFLAALLKTQQPADPEPPRSFPASHWDLRYTEAVLLVELFEEEFGTPAKFSYQRLASHGALLRRILDRFNRFSWADPRYQGNPDGPLERRPGCRRAAELIRKRARWCRLGNPKIVRPNSLAYFLPRLDQESKALRRRARELEAAEAETP